ncbi:MAG: T9SS type A sorting domain-containing protein [Bacteroidota bacterium]|nr:T9SS type A sorting domain-containing protein [Bacteroidota bacterium]
MKHIYLFLFFFPILLAAQTTHLVDVGGSTSGSTDPYYAPQELTIDVGDIVHWTNSSGTHNVNGSAAAFPDNPEGFFSGQPESDLDFSFTFNTPGAYHYHCDQQGHSATQFGMINVIGGNSVEENSAAINIELFPIPTSDLLVVEFGDQEIERAEIHSVDGRLISSQAVNGRSRIEVSTTSLVSGQYFLRLTDAKGHLITRPFRKA